MINVITLRQQLLPISHSGLVHDEINCLGLTPFPQYGVFVYGNIAVMRANVHFVVRWLVHQIKSSMQIKDETARTIEAALVNHFVIFAEPAVEEPAGLGQRELRSHPRDSIDKAKSNRQHGHGHGGACQPRPLR